MGTRIRGLGEKMADNRCGVGVAVALICVLSLSSIQQVTGGPSCNVGSLTSDNKDVNQLHNEECFTPTNLPLPSTPHVTSHPPTVPSTTKNVTPMRTQSTVITVEANQTSPNVTVAKGTQSPETTAPSTTRFSNDSETVNTSSVQPNVTQPSSSNTTTHAEKSKRSIIEFITPSPVCMIFKYFNEDTLKFGTTAWTADFSCDTAGVCANQTNCKEHAEVNGKKGYLCCCQGDKCNTPDLLDRKLPINPTGSVKECFINSHNESAPVTKFHCDEDTSQYCMNITQKEETSYYCGSERGYQKWCSQFNLTQGGCYSGMVNGQEMTVCCCNKDNCNADSSYVVATIKASHFDYNIVIYVLSSMIIIVLIITVALLLVKRRKAPMDPDMVQITYSRLTADLADG